MKVTVKFIGFASAFSGRDIQSVDLTEGATIELLLAAIRSGEGNTADNILPMASFLVNKEKADRSTILHEGDEVMILFFLGGG